MPIWPFTPRRAAPLPHPRDTTLTISLPAAELDPRPLKGRRAQLEANLSWVYACSSLIAADVRANPWGLWRQRGRERERLPDNHPAARLLARPNGNHTWGSLIELTDLHLSLTGEAYWQVITNPEGRAVGLAPIYPHWLDGSLQDDLGRVTHYRITVPGRAPSLLPEADLVPFRLPHPLEPQRGASPVEAFAASLDMDLYARAYGAALLRNRAQPDGLLLTDKEVSREQANVIRERWRDSHAQPGQVGVLGQGVRYQPLSLPLRDLEFQDLARLTRDQILAIYKVPASKLGLLENASLANGREADQNYKESALRPRLERYQEAINTLVLPRLPETRGARFLFENPVDEDREYELERATRALAAGAIRVNEYRHLIGLEPAAGGDVYLVPDGVRVAREL